MALYNNVLFCFLSFSAEWAKKSLELSVEISLDFTSSKKSDWLESKHHRGPLDKNRAKETGNSG